jgi:hypothetical protein
MQLPVFNIRSNPHRGWKMPGKSKTCKNNHNLEILVPTGTFSVEKSKKKQKHVFERATERTPEHAPECTPKLTPNIGMLYSESLGKILAIKHCEYNFPMPQNLERKSHTTII